MSQIIKDLKKIAEFTLTSKPNQDEYCYNVLFTSNTGTKYISYDNWTAYAENATDAKTDIVKRMQPAMILLMSDIILEDSNNTPYFVTLN